eukprot:scaffold133975_cov81-Phaeocystis_antarctica.AAC.1
MHMYMYMCMYVTLRARRHSLSANSRPADRSATFGSPHGARRRGERVQKAGAIGGSAALSTRGAAPGR